MNSPAPDLIARTKRILREKTTAWTPVNRGYTPAERWLATTSSSGVFVKCGVTSLTARWLRREFHAYGQVKGSFIPELVGWEDDERAPLLILEDLSQSFWPPPWTRERIDRVRECLDEMHAARPVMPPFPAIHPLGHPQRQYLHNFTQREADRLAGIVPVQSKTRPGILAAKSEIGGRPIAGSDSAG